MASFSWTRLSSSLQTIHFCSGRQPALSDSRMGVACEKSRIAADTAASTAAVHCRAGAPPAFVVTAILTPWQATRLPYKFRADSIAAMAPGETATERRDYSQDRIYEMAANDAIW